MGVGGTQGSGGKQTTGVEPEAPEQPVSAELLERERADRDEDKARIAALESEVARLRAELASARAAAASAARRAEIERELAAAGAIDLEITAPLVERAVSAMDEPDIAAAVREVKAGKGFLFRAVAGGGVRSAAMAGEPARAGLGLEDLASDARTSGDRGDLLRYLRARRG
jgi:hypothetical protein